MPLTQFAAKRAQRNQCYNVERQVKVNAEEQEQTYWLDKMAPGEKMKLCKTFAKMKKKQGRSKFNFNLMEYKTRVKRSKGTRTESRKKMMWYEEYKEHAETAAGGKLTEGEIAAMWKWNGTATGVRRDLKGPRGARRCNVFVGDFSIGYDDLAKEDEVEAHTATKRKATQADFAKALVSLQSRRDTDAVWDHGEDGETLNVMFDKAEKSFTKSVVGCDEQHKEPRSYLDDDGDFHDIDIQSLVPAEAEDKTAWKRDSKKAAKEEEETPQKKTETIAEFAGAVARW